MQIIFSAPTNISLQARPPAPTDYKKKHIIPGINNSYPNAVHGTLRMRKSSSQEATTIHFMKKNIVLYLIADGGRKIKRRFLFAAPVRALKHYQSCSMELVNSGVSCPYKSIEPCPNNSSTLGDLSISTARFTTYTIL